MCFDELYQRAKNVINPKKFSKFTESGGVGAAIFTNIVKINCL